MVGNSNNNHTSMHLAILAHLRVLVGEVVQQLVPQLLGQGSLLTKTLEHAHGACVLLVHQVLKNQYVEQGPEDVRSQEYLQEEQDDGRQALERRVRGGEEHARERHHVQGLV